MIVLTYWQLAIVLLSVCVFTCASGVWIGLNLFPYVMHWKASRSDALYKGKPFDKSNFANTQITIAWFGTHAVDLCQLSYDNGFRPFEYLTKDLITDIMKLRPK